MSEVVNWFQALITGFANVGEWLFTPLPGFGVSPIVLASSVGLLIFLGVAIGKWIWS